jgi:hypothetical protein
MDNYFLDADDYKEDEQDEKFIVFVDKLSEKNRKLHVRREIERREETLRLRDTLGIESFYLEAGY